MVIGKKVRHYVGEAFALLLSLIVLIPLYMLFIGSFKNSAEASRFSLALPTEWNIIENYTRMFKLGGLSTAFKNSIIITVTSVVILIAISSTSAFILQRRKSRFTGLAYNMIILGLVIPGSIIPMFFISKFMHLTDIPQIAAILNLVVSQFPLAVFIYFGGFKGIPQQIDESAFIDGSSLLRLFTTIVFPLLKPVTATIVIISFMNIWNNFNLTLYFLNSPKTFTLTLTIYNFMSTYNSDWNLVFANIEYSLLKTDEIQIRDPFVLPVAKERKYYLYGTTDKNAWGGKATGFDVYVSFDLENWEGPFAAFRPEAGFWADENFWDPEVHLYNGDYYMFASFKTEGKCRGTQILSAKSPFGPFSPHSEGPVTPYQWECLDGTLYIDENQEPWMVFCHEWLQVDDGEMCAIRLTKDLKKSAGEPILLFRASEAPWTHHHDWNDTKQKKQYVTDGPFLFISPEGRLNMLWSSYTEAGYAIGLAHSASNKITGPWEHNTEPVYSRDGGHGMLFKTFEGQLKLTIHSPNDTPNERAIFINVNLSDYNLICE